MKEFTKKGWARASLDRLIQKLMLTNRRPGSGRPKSVRTTDNIAVVQDLVYRQDDEVMRPVLCGAPYLSTL